MNSLPRGRPRGRRRHEPDLPELRPGAVDRDLLHADDRRAGGDPAARDGERTARPTACRRRPPPRRPAAARCRSCSPPSSATTRSSTCSARTCSPRLTRAQPGVAHRARVLPPPDLGAVPQRAARGVRVRDRRLSGRRRRVAAARRPLPLCRRTARAIAPRQGHRARSCVDGRLAACTLTRVSAVGHALPPQTANRPTPRVDERFACPARARSISSLGALLADARFG